MNVTYFSVILFHRPGYNFHRNREKHCTIAPTVDQFIPKHNH